MIPSYDIALRLVSTGSPVRSLFSQRNRTSARPCIMAVFMNSNVSPGWIVWGSCSRWLTSPAKCSGVPVTSKSSAGWFPTFLISKRLPFFQLESLQLAERSGRACFLRSLAASAASASRSVADAADVALFFAKTMLTIAAPNPIAALMRPIQSLPMRLSLSSP